MPGTVLTRFTDDDAKLFQNMAVTAFGRESLRQTRNAAADRIGNLKRWLTTERHNLKVLDEALGAL